MSVWTDPETNKPKFWGRFNKGVVTINLPDVALTIWDKYHKDGSELKDNSEAMDEFWKLFDERLELCHKALLRRCEYLKGTKSDVAPILWQNGAIARLKSGEVIDKYLEGGYSTTSLGYVGLYETLMALTGKTHMCGENFPLALLIVKHMYEKCNEWNKIPNQNYGFSLYGTPEESTTYKFAKSLQKRHGIIPNITDKLYVTNSYHYFVRENVDAFTKLSNESEFQRFTTGGAISYVETPNMANNIEAVLTILKHIYNHIMYAELNCKLDYCHKCGFDGEIQLVEDENKKLIWKCPSCGNTDKSSMNTVRRVCGYMADGNDFNQGRKREIADRVLHI